MNAPTRLALFGAALLVAFGVAFGIARVAVPDSVVRAWTDSSRSHGTHDDHDDHVAPPATAPVTGTSLSADGYVLGPVSAPGQVGEPGTLSFRIDDPRGTPLTSYATEHEQDLHLIVVRSDGARFRHVHPSLDAATGVWSLPWTWDAAGTYRVFADFVPGGHDTSPLTLSRTVAVAGEVTPWRSEPSRIAQVDGLTVTLTGDLPVGYQGTLTAAVTRDGTPVTTLQPYLGAFGHLVALREGDLAYLHVHPHGDTPGPGATGGPEIAFSASAPTAGRYLLYLDFQLDGAVHTAAFVVDAA
ncbi:heavy-metal-associated domain-containing protein [Gordonia sp. FQ]|uniref:heavy-metal-associated domain-containing protein n=1 Tax=Gordonia sp. FQ TaxID=3446634 RepID=UPI003F8453D0